MKIISEGIELCVQAFADIIYLKSFIDYISQSYVILSALLYLNQKQSQDRVHKLLEASSAKLMQTAAVVSDDQSSGGGDSGGQRSVIVFV